MNTAVITTTHIYMRNDSCRGRGAYCASRPEISGPSATPAKLPTMVISEARVLSAASSSSVIQAAPAPAPSPIENPQVPVR